MDEITAVECCVVDGGSRTWVFVVVSTADGLSGVGEATLEWHTEPVVAAIKGLADLVVGEDPSRIQHIWQVGSRSRFWRGGPVLLSALSGLEQALWDIKGKRAGMPVHELLGGRCRERLLLYANFPDGVSPNEMASALGERRLRAVKITPFSEPVLTVDGYRGALEAAVEETEAVREAIGPDIRLAIDVHGRLSPQMSVIYARAVERLDIWFLEEPALPDDLEGIAEVARKTSIPVAAGERVFTRRGFEELLSAGGISLVQPDLAHCGGVFEGRLVAAMAEPRQIGFAPHNPMSPVNTMVSAQVSLTVPNFVALEHKIGDAPWRHELARPDAEIEDGYLVVGSSPGLGIEFDAEVGKLHPPQARKVQLETHLDGALAER